MTFGTLKKLIRQLTELYFTGATVRYSEQSFTPKPSSPLVTLTFGSVNRPRDPPMRFIDGRPVSYYPASVPVQIDLFTNGRQEKTEPGFTPIVENTAEEDLLSFSSFLNSPYATQWCDRENISIVIPNEVRDLTGLIHDTNYEFRACAQRNRPKIRSHHTGSRLNYDVCRFVGATGTMARELACSI